MTFGKDEFWMVLQTLARVVSTVAVFLAWWQSRNSTSKERINAMEKRLDNELAAVRTEVSRVQERLNAVPTHKDLEAISQFMQEVGSKVDSLAGKFEGTQSTVNIIHDYLLNGKR